MEFCDLDHRSGAHTWEIDQQILRACCCGYLRDFLLSLIMMLARRLFMKGKNGCCIHMLARYIKKPLEASNPNFHPNFDCETFLDLLNNVSVGRCFQLA